MPEQTVQLPVDSTANKNLFRVVQVLPASALAEYTASGFAPMQEVVALAGDDGTIVGVVDGGALRASDEGVQQLLRAICLRLDLIGGALSRDYSPPDNFNQGN